MSEERADGVERGRDRVAHERVDRIASTTAAPGRAVTRGDLVQYSYSVRTRASCEARCAVVDVLVVPFLKQCGVNVF